MADDVYVVDLLAGTPAVTVTDDGTGIDWLVLNGTYASYADIRLDDISVGGVATSAWARFDLPGGITRILRVNGAIENYRGSNSADFIGGNELGNIIYCDAAATGVGGNDTVDANNGNDTVYGGSGADQITGDLGNDLLYGDDGDDTITGNGGNDTLIGGLGADALFGGGEDQQDVVSYATSNAGVQIQLTYGSSTTATGGHAQGDQLRGFSDAIGSSYNDTITDTVSGTIAFGYNDNVFKGNGGNDLLVLGGGNDKGYGGSGRDSIDGGIGSDLLSGGTGTDTLNGGAGRDLLYGGTGIDTFIYNSASDSTLAAAGRDTIYDFKRVEGDKIDLSVIDADPSSVGMDQAFTWLGSAAFNGTHGALRVVNSGLNTLVQGDLNGDGVADLVILVAKINDMVSTDFIL